LSELEDSPELSVLYYLEAERYVHQMKEHLAVLRRTMSNGKQWRKQKAISGLYFSTNALHQLSLSLGLKHIEAVSRTLLDTLLSIKSGTLSKPVSYYLDLISEDIEACQKLIHSKQVVG
jgi:hypothetical protein